MHAYLHANPTWKSAYQSACKYVFRQACLYAGSACLHAKSECRLSIHVHSADCLLDMQHADLLPLAPLNSIHVGSSLPIYATFAPISAISTESTETTISFKRFFTPDSNCKTRGNRQKLQIPKLSNSAARTNFFALRIVPVWNYLTDDIILCGNNYAFVSNLIV